MCIHSFVASGDYFRDLLDGFTWDERWRDSFDSLVSRGIFVPPILHVLAFPRRVEAVQAWANEVAQWDFVRIVPAHLDGPVAATPRDFLAAINTALFTPPSDVFGDDAAALVAVEKLSVDIGSLEKTKPKSK